jgi:hypothetical protein
MGRARGWIIQSDSAEATEFIGCFLSPNVAGDIRRSQGSQKEN